MGRIQGPQHRMCRRVGERLCTSDKCPATRRQQPPGMHGPKGYRRLTEFGTQLREKQKARFMYGVMEQQFRRYYEQASARTGNTAENFLQVLERRLDNVVLRLGFARTRRQARQMVSHGLVMVNGSRVTIPSYQVRVGEQVQLQPAVRGGVFWKSIAAGRQSAVTPSWLSVDIEGLSGKVLALPVAEDFPPNINMALVVEYYSR